MKRYVQQELGRCDFVDVLEESVLMGARVKVTLKDDTYFEDHLKDVVTANGQEVVRFQLHDPVEVRQISWIEREPLPHTYPT